MLRQPYPELTNGLTIESLSGLLDFSIERRGGCIEHRKVSRETNTMRDRKT